METLENRIEDFLLDVKGFYDRKDVEDFKNLIRDIANPKE